MWWCNVVISDCWLCVNRKKFSIKKMLWTKFKNFLTVYLKHISLSQCLDKLFLIDLLSFEEHFQKRKPHFLIVAFFLDVEVQAPQKNRGYINLIVSGFVKSCKGRKVLVSKLWSVSFTYFHRQIFMCCLSQSFL